MPNRSLMQAICRAALAEDVGQGDATTLAVVPAEIETQAYINTRQECVCAGLQIAEVVFQELEPKIGFEPLVKDGAVCAPHTPLARINGRARAILTGERLALNFLQRLSGIASLTRAFVQAVGNHPTKILDTRKTTPGLRALEKYAVCAGGGWNHRFGLYDRILIKDNHRLLANLEGPGGIARAVRAARAAYPNLEVEIEADTLDEVAEAVEAKVEFILLDNMSDDEIREAVELVAGRAQLEASGGMTLDRIGAVAAAGVDFISVGALTHSAPAIDIALDLVHPGTGNPDLHKRDGLFAP